MNNIVKYWVAKYVEDVFRKEPRNIGVIACLDGRYASLFYGEREDGSLDARRLGKQFAYPSVYFQWRTFWRRELESGDISHIVSSATDNYYVEVGGEVSDVDDDGVADVCKFLYDLLVGEGPSAAYQWESEADLEVNFVKDIENEFQRIGVIAYRTELFLPHPIVKGSAIEGSHVVHKPTFSQRNGSLNVIEHIDFSGKPIKITERAGWMAYMFSDIHSVDANAHFYSLVYPSQGNPGDCIEYANNILSSESNVVIWSDENDRQRFLEERLRIAQSSE